MAPTDSVVLPASITGLNIETGLRRVMGKKALYVNLLRKFLSGQHRTCAEVNRALDSGDDALAERLAHTCKGVAGSIGANDVQEAARQLEAAITRKSPREEIDSHLTHLASQLQPLLDSLQAWAAGPQETPMKEVLFDAQTFNAVCEQLREYLGTGDSKAEDLITSQETLLRAGLKTHFPALQRAVQDFDFELALTLIPAHG